MNLSDAPRGSLFALLLILAGVLLFLDNVGVLPIEDIRAYWPLWLVVWGVAVLDKKRTAVGVIWALALIACGSLLILGNLHIIPATGGIVWPVVLIAFGATMLVRPGHMRFETWPGRFHMNRARRWGASPSNVSGNRLNEAVVFGSLNRRVETQQFAGGKVDAVFGSIELDLTEAAISSLERRAELEVNAVFGGIEIRVPRTWKVLMKNTAVFGGCNDHTVPPRPEPGVEPVTLVVTGGAVFGGIEIRN